MGGIGKTTLANKVYNDACIRSHFDVRAWATVSQQHNVKEILLSLLRSTKGGVRVGFMDQDESWNLFKSASFANEALPYEYENIWKQIVDECQGIPLTIIVVVGLLKSKREIQNWTSVVKDVKSFVTNDPDE
ncbi:hypothetical protein FXO38_02557 [Capsicum annuum]|nr:hypothetical protein FXO38_02557 [Capsicum annuum]KAF3682040.1 hypothetical protein FXO37_02566 [Capsicum annuum]